MSAGEYWQASVSSVVQRSLWRLDAGKYKLPSSPKLNWHIAQFSHVPKSCTNVWSVFKFYCIFYIQNLYISKFSTKRTLMQFNKDVLASDADEMRCLNRLCRLTNYLRNRLICPSNWIGQSLTTNLLLVFIFPNGCTYVRIKKCQNNHLISFI